MINYRNQKAEHENYRTQDAILAKLAEAGYVTAMPPSYRKELDRDRIARDRIATHETALHALLSEAHNVHNPTGKWKSERFPSKYGKEDAQSLSGTSTGRFLYLSNQDKQWIRMSAVADPQPVATPYIPTALNPERKINTEPQPCKVQHVVHIDGVDYEYTPKLKQEILRQLYNPPIRHFTTRSPAVDADHSLLEMQTIAMAMAKHLDSGDKTVKFSNPTKETPMSIFKSVTTHFVNDNNAAQMSDDELFAQLARGEQQLEKLKTIKTPSKKLAAQIEDMQGQLTKLAEYIDSRK